jgi:hypothetical protein
MHEASHEEPPPCRVVGDAFGEEIRVGDLECDFSIQNRQPVGEQAIACVGVAGSGADGSKHGVRVRVASVAHPPEAIEPGERGIRCAGEREGPCHGVDDAWVAWREPERTSDVRCILGSIPGGLGPGGEAGMAEDVTGLLLAAGREYERGDARNDDG